MADLRYNWLCNAQIWVQVKITQSIYSGWDGIIDDREGIFVEF